MQKLLHKCPVCRWYESGHYQIPPPPPPPEFRLDEKPPFTFTGVDFAGPLYVAILTPLRPVRYGCACLLAVLSGLYT